MTATQQRDLHNKLADTETEWSSSGLPICSSPQIQDRMAIIAVWEAARRRGSRTRKFAK